MSADSIEENATTPRNCGALAFPAPRLTPSVEKNTDRAFPDLSAHERLRGSSDYLGRNKAGLADEVEVLVRRQPFARARRRNCYGYQPSPRLAKV
jgi:hypothetical protein